MGDLHNDPTWEQLVKSSSKKLLLEPIPSIYEKLIKNVQKSNMANYALINAAISVGTDAKELKMYCAGDPSTPGGHIGLPKWHPNVFKCSLKAVSFLRLG